MYYLCLEGLFGFLQCLFIKQLFVVLRVTYGIGGMEKYVLYLLFRHLC